MHLVLRMFRHFYWKTSWKYWLREHFDLRDITSGMFKLHVWMQSCDWLPQNSVMSSGPSTALPFGLYMEGDEMEETIKGAVISNISGLILNLLFGCLWCCVLYCYDDIRITHNPWQWWLVLALRAAAQNYLSVTERCVCVCHLHVHAVDLHQMNLMWRICSPVKWQEPLMHVLQFVLFLCSLCTL